MHDDDDNDNDDLSSLSYFIYFALKPHLLSLGLKREAKNKHVALSTFLQQGGEVAPPLVSHLTKACDEDSKIFCSMLLPSYLSATRLCLTVRVLVEHGSSDTFHISCSLLCARLHL